MIPGRPAAPRCTRRLRRQIAAGWFLVTGFVAVAAAVVDIHEHVRLFECAWLAAFAGHVLVVRGVWLLPADRLPGRWSVWFAGFVVLRAALTHTVPSDDLHRYIWEGKIQRHGFNPYLAAPADERLSELRAAESWSRINHPEYPAIYPPLAELLFRVIAGLGSSVIGAKLVFVALEVACIAIMGHLLTRLGQPPHLAGIYALSPLSFAAFAIEGHVDSLMLLWLMVAAALAIRRGLYACGVALGLAIAAKLVCVVTLAWLALKKPAAAALAVVVAAATFLPYADAGWSVFDSLIRFGRTENNLGLVFVAIRTVADAQVARWGCGLALAVWAGFLAARSPTLPQFATRAMAAMVLFMPVVHFWYLTWFLSFTWARWSTAWLVLSGSMVFYFEAHHQRVVSGEWSMPTAAYLLVYAPFLAALAAEYGQRLRARGRSPGSLRT